jgi:hypothetical protein
MNTNPFNILDKAKKQINLDDAWDRELQTIKENRVRYGLFKKERELRLNQERKKKNHE